MTADSRTGGQILVDQLLIHGVRMGFCVPGESYIAVLDALHHAQKSIRLITTRVEIGAANMAEAYGKLTGEPGICFVTRGPGASHAMVGVHTALQDSTPLILFVGLIPRRSKEREAFQEIDIKAMFGHTTKWAAEITMPQRIPEMISHAFHIAVSGRPGPVVLGLPEDMLTERCLTADVAPYQPVRASPSRTAMNRFGELLGKAQRPMLLVGGGGWTTAAYEDLRAFAETANLPVCASFRCQHLFDNRHDNYIGDCSLSVSPELTQRIRDADLLVVLGARLGELTTQGYKIVEPPVPKQSLVHIHSDPNELGRVYQGTLLINSGIPEFLSAANELPAPAHAHAHRDSWTKAARKDYRNSLVPAPCSEGLDLGTSIRSIADRMPRDTIVAIDAGNLTGWVNRYYPISEFGAFLGPTSGAMGYGVPAAIAAKLVYPKRPVLCFAGDGGFLMTGQELATAVQYRANVVFFVVNNGMYGTIKMYQARQYPGRYPATELKNPDFAAFARSFGCHGETVSKTEETMPALDRSLSSGKPALIELKTNPNMITTRTTSSALEETASRS